MNVCVLHVCLGKRPEEDARSSESSYKQLQAAMQVWSTDLGPLREQQVSFTTKATSPVLLQCFLVIELCVLKGQSSL